MKIVKIVENVQNCQHCPNVSTNVKIFKKFQHCFNIVKESLLGNFLTFNDMSYVPKSKVDHWVSEWVSQWQCHLLGCPQTLSGQLKRKSMWIEINAQNLCELALMLKIYIYWHKWSKSACCGCIIGHHNVKSSCRSLQHCFIFWMCKVWTSRTRFPSDL